jgi:sterol-4alpha-carboxylate 3-dehydrogenase (decarboxylating)
MVPNSSAPIVLGKVLVVGGCGFLGYNVVDQLLNFPSEDNLPTSKASAFGPSSKNNDPASLTFPTLRSRYPIYEQTEVHVLDLRCSRNRLPRATYHEANLCDPESLLRVFRKVKPEVVINTASPLYNAAADILRKVNIEGTRNLLDVAGGIHGDWGGRCKAFVHTSSSSVVHDGQTDLINADERWPYVRPHPVEYYTETKACSLLVLNLNANHRILTGRCGGNGATGEQEAQWHANLRNPTRRNCRGERPRRNRGWFPLGRHQRSRLAA